MTGTPLKSTSRHTKVEVEPVKPLLTRHKVQVLRQAGHTQEQVSEYTDVGLRTVRRIAREPPVQDLDDPAERKKRKIGRPSKTEVSRNPYQCAPGNYHVGGCLLRYSRFDID